MLGGETSTFAMADIAGSSRWWNNETELMSQALVRHDEIAAVAVNGADGHIFKHTGDGFLAEFDSADGAVEAMRRYQQALKSEPWPEPIWIRSRVALHVGVAERREGDRFGPVINHLARVTDLVEPSHVVLTEPTVDALGPARAHHPLQSLGTYRVRDLPEPLGLHMLDLSTAVGPALTLDAGHGLPRFATPILGRDSDLGTLEDRLASSRLVTVVGFGGMGKTRLAVEAAHRHGNQTARRAVFVDLAVSSDPLQALAEAIGLPLGNLDDRQAPFAAIAKHLRGLPTLVVVDNCEHVIDEAAAMVAGLLDAAPDVQVLATSREPLELDDEFVHPLGPLAEDDAGALFVARASGAAVALPDAGTIDALVGAVDALPLGIELVVARLRTMDPTELLLALDGDLGVLRTRRRSRQPESTARTQRHGNLHSLVAWSVDLLAPDERDLLLTLAALPVPTDRATVTSLDRASGGELVEELEAKSLVHRDPSGLYGMYEMVRQYCAGVLDAEPATRQRVDHALVDWATGAAPAVRSAANLTFDPQRARELVGLAPNYRAALAAAARVERHEDAAGIVTGLWQLVVDARSRRWFDDAVLRALATARDPEISAILVRLAFQGQVGEAADLQRQAELEAALDAVDPTGVSPVRAVQQINDAVTALITNHVFGQDLGPTRDMLDELVRGCEATDHVLDAAAGHLYIGFAHLLDRDTARGRARSAMAADAGRRCGFAPLVGLAEAATALADAWDGAAATAVDRAAEAVRLAADARWESTVRAVHAVVAAAAGDHVGASAARRDLVELALDVDNPFVTFDAAIGCAALDVALGDDAAAREMLDHTSMSRTPLTLALLWETERSLGTVPPLDRFTDVLDPDAFRVRAERTIAHLRDRFGIGGSAGNRARG